MPFGNVSMDEKNSGKWIFPVVLVALGVILFFVARSVDSIGKILELLGSLSSILGIFFVIKQVYDAKTIAQQTKEAVATKLNRVDKALAISNISEIIPLPKEIKENIRDGKYELAQEKMGHLRLELIDLENDPANKLNKTKIDGFVGDLTNSILFFEKNDASRIRNTAYESQAKESLDNMIVFLKSLSSEKKYSEMKESK